MATERGDETLEEAAIREALEELGCEVVELIAIGYLFMQSEGEVPEGWKYPHPHSYQQFFVARVVKVYEYYANDECAEPLRFSQVHDADREARPQFYALIDEAKRVMGPFA